MYAQLFMSLDKIDIIIELHYNVQVILVSGKKSQEKKLNINNKNTRKHEIIF